MGIFDSFEKILDLPEKILDKGENTLDDLLSLPDKILKLLEMMIIPGMLIAGVMVISEIRK